ncbi:MAG: cereblon family protein [Thermodesulfobacteriota bacterium]
MLAFVRTPKNQDPTHFHCVRCGTLIADSNSLVSLNGSAEHAFVNPAGIRCVFKTFQQCEHVLADPTLHPEHSWFVGYGWRILVCRVCYAHLGWQYDALEGAATLPGFFGLLSHAVRSEPPVG